MMSVPSSEFTFSASPPSTVVFTPSSSTKDSSSEGSFASAPHSPRPTLLLFQDLNLNHTEGSTATPRAKSWTARLSSDNSPSAYAQQHNATLSPSRKLTPGPRGSQVFEGNRSIFSSASQGSSYPDNKSKETKSIFSDDGTDKVRIPGAFPAQSDRGQNHILEDTTEPEDGTESDQDSDILEGESAANDIREEPLPAAPVYDNRLRTGLEEVKGQLASLADMMGLSELKQDQSTALHSLYGRTREMSMFEYPESRTVGFIGDSGVGKSSLINSLLDEQNLSRSSSEGAACTCVVTEFRHVDSNHTGPFTIEAQFMTPQEMKDLLDELLSSFRQFHVTSYFQELKSTEEQERCRESAQRAWETFASLYGNRPALTMEFLSVDSDGAHSDLLAHLERWAYAGLALRPGGSDALEYSVIAGDLKECKESLDLLTANNIGDGKPALWPFIKLIRVYLSSPILRTGLILADLPGLRDLNFARVRATERYLAHNCDEVFVVADIARACTNPSVQDVLRRCRDGQPRRVVLTKSEAVSPEESAWGNTPDALQVQSMNKDIKAIRKQIEKAESMVPKASRGRQAELALKGYKLREKEEELEFQMDRFLINRRNSLVSQELMNRHAGIRIFCISNTLYSKHRRSRKSQADAYIDLTGIRELRRYCQLVPAESQMRATTAFLEHQVPALLGSLRQWALSGTYSVTAEKSAILRHVLGNAQDALHREFISSRSCLHLTHQGLNDLFNECITEVIRNSKARWTDETIKISLVWEGWAHGTYSAFCSKFGEHATGKQPYRCWNDELIQPAREELNPKWEEVLDWLQSQTEVLVEKARTTFGKLREEIESHIQLATDALDNLQRSMKSRLRCIEDHIRDSFQKMIQSLVLTKRNMLYGHASSFVSGLMQPAYAAINRERGPGSDCRRKSIMREHLTHSRLFAELSNLTSSEYTNIATHCFDALQKGVNEQIESVVRDFHAVVSVDGQLPEAELAPALAGALRARFGRTEEILQFTQGVAQELTRS